MPRRKFAAKRVQSTEPTEMLGQAVFGRAWGKEGSAWAHQAIVNWVVNLRNLELDEDPELWDDSQRELVAEELRNLGEVVIAKLTTHEHQFFRDVADFIEHCRPGENGDVQPIEPEAAAVFKAKFRAAREGKPQPTTAELLDLGVETTIRSAIKRADGADKKTQK